MAGSDLVQALARGLRILELAAASEDGVSVTQITEALGIKQPTAHNLTRTLIANGYLVRRSSPVRYALGPAVDSLSLRGNKRKWREHAEDSVRGLAARLPAATVILAEWRAGDLAVFMRVHPSHPGHIELNPAMRLSPFTSACTLCFQAFAPAPEVGEFRKRYPHGETEIGRWSGLDELDEFLRKARRAGAVVLSDEKLYRVAAPIWGEQGRLVAVAGASINAAGGISNAESTEVFAQVSKAAQELSAQLGAGGEGKDEG